MKRKILIIVLSIALCIVSGVLAYFISLKVDMAKKGGSVDVTVTFDDTETYVIPTLKKMSKEEALKEWPYKITVNNTGTAKGLYQIIIEDEKESIKRDNLDYALYLDEKEIKEGHLKDVKNNILYNYEINANTTQKYDLYIWNTVEEEKDEKEENKDNKEKKENEVKESKYEYKLTFNTIKDGGPGF